NKAEELFGRARAHPPRLGASMTGFTPPPPRLQQSSLKVPFVGGGARHTAKHPTRPDKTAPPRLSLCACEGIPKEDFDAVDRRSESQEPAAEKNFRPGFLGHPRQHNKKFLPFDDQVGASEFDLPRSGLGEEFNIFDFVQHRLLL